MTDEGSDANGLSASMTATLDEGLTLFEEGKYFLAHEIWEEEWVEASGNERDFLQGIIHVTIAMHHASSGNARGSVLQANKALKRLESYPPVFRDVSVENARQCAQSIIEKEGKLPPAAPKLRAT